MAHETRAGILAGKPTLSPPIDTTERGVIVMVDEHSETTRTTRSPQWKADRMEVVSWLHMQAATRFDRHGPQDARGAALWNAACALNPDDGDVDTADVLIPGYLRTPTARFVARIYWACGFLAASSLAGLAELTVLR